MGARFRCSLLLLLVGGCTGLNPLYSAGDAEDTDATHGSDPEGLSSSGRAPSPKTSTGSADSGPSADSDGSSSMGAGTTSTTSGTAETVAGTTKGPEPIACSTFDQNCPEGSKCMPYATDGGLVWNALDCFPIDEAPNQVADPCLVDGGPTSGVDDCDGSSMCWNVDAETLSGTCAAFCLGTPDDPSCADPAATCSETADGLVNVCLTRCDPLLQDCPPGFACGAVGTDFECVEDASTGTPTQGASCGFVNDCWPGWICLPGAALAECPSSSCCVPFCDLADAACTGGSVCEAYYEPDSAPVGLEDVGVCVAP